MERPIDSHQLPSTTLFNWVLSPPTKGHETTPATIGIPRQDGMLRLWGRAQLFLHMVPTWPPICSPGAPTVPTFPPHQSIGSGATFYPALRFLPTL